MNPSDVMSRIERAWAGVSRPRTDRIFTPASFDDEGIVNYFGGTTWKGHRAADLRAHSSAFTFFTPVAWHYWLPAFVEAALMEPGEADVCVKRIAESIYDCYAEERVPLLTAEQREALCDYFEYQIALLGDRWSDAEQRALSRLRDAA